MPGLPLSKLLCFIALLLSACSLPTPPANQAAQHSQSAATQAALAVQTEIARPSPTLTPSPTSTPSLPSATPLQAASSTPGPDATQASAGKVTALPGLELVSFPDVPDYVFQADLTRWSLETGGATSSLVHKTIANCRIDSVLGRGIGPPQRYMWQDLGRFRWEILDYGSTALIDPVLGNGIGTGGNSFLELKGYNLPACRTAQEKVLANLMTSREAAGDIPFGLYASPTPRPALEGFSCPNTPATRLRVGDWVSVITDGLWLRSAPRADQSTKMTSFLRYAPVMIHVTGGPVCEKYVYWQVEVITFGEGSETKRGWLAEGDPQEYYITPVK